MNTKKLQTLLAKEQTISDEVRSLLADVLEEINQPIKFNWKDGDAPSYPSTKFGNDLADSYVTKIWFDRGLIKVNLHAYYLSQDAENIDLADETCVYYAELLEYVLNNLPDGFGDEPANNEDEVIVAGDEETMESIEVSLTKERTPRAFENRVQCLMISGMSREDAEKAAYEPIELELFYEIGYGLFAVDSMATESYGACHSPYTSKEIVPFED